LYGSVRKEIFLLLSDEVPLLPKAGQNRALAIKGPGLGLYGPSHPSLLNEFRSILIPVIVDKTTPKYRQDIPEFHFKTETNPPLCSFGDQLAL
jgi:hypothetical protein